LLNQLTIIHARSIAENIVFSKEGENYTGSLNVDEGKIQLGDTDVEISGNSLIHSAPLTAEAFKKSWLGDWGQYIVSIGLLLFAFSTAISWSYYGGRAMTFLFGSKSVIYYRILYVLGFFIASFTDTTIIWIFSGITIAFMTIPNLIGIFSLHREMKQTVKKYWKDFKNDHPDVNIPEKV